MAFTSISADGRYSMAGTTSGFNSEVDEEEVDQLDSGSDGEEEVGEEMEPEVEDEGASSSKGRRKLGVRVPGHTLVPQDKLDNILQAEASGAGQHMSKEAVFMLSIATEEFIKRLAEAGSQQSITENRQHVQYRDMAYLAQRRSEYRFLEDTIPTPISITQAMALRAAKERELLEDDPAISAIAPPSPPPAPHHPTTATTISASKPVSKTRPPGPAPTNGTQKPKANGSASAAGASASESTSAANASTRQRYRDSNGRWRRAGTANGARSNETPNSTASTRTGSARIRNRSARAREAAEAEESVSHAPHQNGVTIILNGRSASSASVQQDVHLSPGSLPQADHWAPGQFTGPASGYLAVEDSGRVSFNGRSMSDNPGRTIYSQQRPQTQPR